MLLGIFCFSFATGIKAQTPKNAEDIIPLLIGEKLPDAGLVDNNGKEVRLRVSENRGNARKCLLLLL